MNLYLKAVFLLLVGVLLLVACTTRNQPEARPTADPETPAAANSQTPSDSNHENTAPTTTSPTPPTPTLLPPEEPPAGTQGSFSTDFTRHTIPYSEILSGGPPKDGIPAIDAPQFVSVAEADEWLEDLEPVTVFQDGDEVRIYPFQILIWHEIVNDVVRGRAVTITFCPLCNTAIVFSATVNGQPLDFGTTGRLRYSNLLMYDRQTESWWQQATGEAVIGELVGTQLTLLPSTIISWAEAQTLYPTAQVLSRETGFNRNYGSNPYVGYDDINSSPFLFEGLETPDPLPAMARVTTVVLGDEAVAYPNEILQQVAVVNDTVGGVPVTVFWQPGLASALDSRQIATGQDVGANAVYERTVNGQVLTFSWDGTVITDAQTGSTWDFLGQATAGELAGQSLLSVVKVDHFWFSWAAFRPDTQVYQP